MQTFFTSDHHFGHERSLRWRPGFASVEHMDDYMVAAWNAVVPEHGARVYHLGDFAFSGRHAAAIRPRLNGTIRLIAGNHDPVKEMVKADLFQRVYGVWREFPEFSFVASHVPIRAADLRHEMRWNVHGHLHDRADLSEPHHINVCVEVRDYRPVHVDEILAEMKARA